MSKIIELFKELHEQSLQLNSKLNEVFKEVAAINKSLIYGPKEKSLDPVDPESEKDLLDFNGIYTLLNDGVIIDYCAKDMKELYLRIASFAATKDTNFLIKILDKKKQELENCNCQQCQINKSKNIDASVNTHSTLMTELNLSSKKPGGQYGSN